MRHKTVSKYKVNVLVYMYLFSKMRTRLNFNFLVEWWVVASERSGVWSLEDTPLKVIKVRAINIKTYIYKLYNENLQTY